MNLLQFYFLIESETSLWPGLSVCWPVSWSLIGWSVCLSKYSKRTTSILLCLINYKLANFLNKPHLNLSRNQWLLFLNIMYNAIWVSHVLWVMKIRKTFRCGLKCDMLGRVKRCNKGFKKVMFFLVKWKSINRENVSDVPTDISAIKILSNK